MSDELSITFINSSSSTFSLDQNGTQLEPGLGKLVTSPGSQLLAYDGYEAMTVQEDASVVQYEDEDLWCCWNVSTPGGNWRFGVKIHQPVQELGIGDSPYWYVMSDQNINSSTIDWVKSGKSNSDPYTWPTDFGFNIVGTPTSHHSSLTVSVMVQTKS